MRTLVPLALTLACSRPAAPTTAVPSGPGPSAQDRTATRCAAGSTFAPSGVCAVPAWTALRFERPVWFTPVPGDPGHRYVVEQAGRVRAIPADPGASTSDVVLDLTDRVGSGHNEEGLLSLAFHPRYVENRRLFVYYTAHGPRRGVLAELTAGAGSPAPIDPSTHRVVLEVAQPYGNHNGGQVLFGPDGYLYLSLGDGGSAGDPHGNGQDTGTLLGSLLRIDVDAERPYGVPADNPLVGGAGRPEIWAWGLRNPWRMAFDEETGALWVADVGQNAVEEVDVVGRGANLGWNLREGTACYTASGCDRAGLVDPVWEYGHDVGVSVTGGYVYRAGGIPDLVGAFLVADFGTQRLWAVCETPGEARVAALGGLGVNPSAIAPDLDGEPIVVGWGQSGSLRRLVAKGSDGCR